MQKEFKILFTDFLNYVCDSSWYTDNFFVQTSGNICMCRQPFDGGLFSVLEFQNCHLCHDYFLTNLSCLSRTTIFGYRHFRMKNVTYFNGDISSIEKGEVNFQIIMMTNKYSDFQICDRHQKFSWKQLHQCVKNLEMLTTHIYGIGCLNKNNILMSNV